MLKNGGWERGVRGSPGARHRPRRKGAVDRGEQQPHGATSCQTWQPQRLVRLQTSNYLANGLSRASEHTARRTTKPGRSLHRDDNVYILEGRRRCGYRCRSSYEAGNYLP